MQLSIKQTIERAFKAGFSEGYHECLHDNTVLHGEDARRIIDEVENPKQLTEEQKRFFEECDLLIKNIKIEIE